MITTTTDYSGRQVDIEFLQTITAPTGSQYVTKSIARTTPKMVAGIQKMVQRYATLLLTRLGDVYMAPDQGTRFIERIMRGNGRTGGFLEQTFAFASTDAISQMRADDNDAAFGVTPDDERIAQATLLGYSMNFATSILSLTVYLETQAGLPVKYVIPVTVPRS
jgi:hypothetical protein